MDTYHYRVDVRMLPPVVMAMVFGAMLLFLEGASERALLVFLPLAPFFYLGAEILARKIVLDSEGITISKFLRSSRIKWSEIQSLDTVRSGQKLFVVLQTGEGSVHLITNTISPFKDLAARLLEHIPPDKVAAGAKEILSEPPAKLGPVVQAWVVCALLMAIVAAKMLGYG
jgi:hypothetical protein